MHSSINTLMQRNILPDMIHSGVLTSRFMELKRESDKEGLQLEVQTPLQVKLYITVPLHGIHR
jgi:hypothetical protein